jgi:hypothetical protein
MSGITRRLRSQYQEFRMSNHTPNIVICFVQVNARLTVQCLKDNEYLFLNFPS